MRKWPDVLPGASYPGYGLSPQSKVKRTAMEVGEARVRQLTQARRDTISVSLILSDPEMGAFRDWFDDLQISGLGDSDNLTGWSSNELTLSLAAETGPGPCIPTLVEPSTALSGRSLWYPMTGLTINDQPLTATVSLASRGISKVRLRWQDRSGAVQTADIDLDTGAVFGTPSLPVSIVARGGGWWRVTADMSTGAGSMTPVWSIVPLGPDGATVWAGFWPQGLLVCESMLRHQGSNGAGRLFLRTGANGRVLGAAGGAGWFQMNVPVGGGFEIQDCRFIDTFDARAGANLEWSVSAKLELRY